MPESRICLTFDVDAISCWPGTLGMRTPGPLSRGEFDARVGVPRILAVLEREEVPATFYIPGHTIDTWPELCRQIRDAGHEIGHHGYLHEPPGGLDRGHERQILERGLRAMAENLELFPRGYRSPSWDLSDNSISLLREFGFQYDSSLFAQDFEPYRCREGDVLHEDAAFEFGAEVDLVEVPVSWSLDDLPQYEFIAAAGGIFPGSGHPPQLQERWINELEFMDEEITGGVFTMTYHPQSTGRGARIRVLEAMIARGKELGAEFTRVGEVAAAWADANPLGRG